MRVLAHGLGGRADLPVPVWLAQYAAAVVLIVTFFMLARFWDVPRLQEPYRGRALPMGLQRFIDAPAFRLALRLIGLAFLTKMLQALLVLQQRGPMNLTSRVISSDPAR